MNGAASILLVFAFVLFAIAALLPDPLALRTRIVAAGLACWVAASFVR